MPSSISTFVVFAKEKEIKLKTAKAMINLIDFMNFSYVIDIITTIQL